MTAPAVRSGLAPVARHDGAGLLEVDTRRAVNHDEGIAARLAEVNLQMPEHEGRRDEVARGSHGRCFPPGSARVRSTEAKQALALIDEEDDRFRLPEHLHCGRVERDEPAPLDRDGGLGAEFAGADAVILLEVRHLLMLSQKPLVKP